MINVVKLTYNWQDNHLEFFFYEVGNRCGINKSLFYLTFQYKKIVRLSKSELPMGTGFQKCKACDFEFLFELVYKQCKVAHY